MLNSEEAINDVVSVLNKAGVEIEKQEAPRKVNLAYEIKKHNEAYFAVILFSASPDQLPVIEETFKFSNFILRYILIKPIVIKKTKISTKEKTSPDDSTINNNIETKQEILEQTKTPSHSVSGQREALTNEDLEKKLEEILK